MYPFVSAIKTIKSLFNIMSVANYVVSVIYKYSLINRANSHTVFYLFYGAKSFV